MKKSLKIKSKRAVKKDRKGKNSRKSDKLSITYQQFITNLQVTVDLEQFFSGYSDGFLEREGWPVILKLEDWQPFNLAKGQWPHHFVEFISCLPFKDYTYPYNGYLNIAVKGPDLSLKLDITPKMNVAYGFEEEVEFGDSVTKLRYDKSDSVNLMTHTSTKDQQHVSDTMEGGALWDIFRRQDVPKLEEYLRTHSAEFSHADNLSIQQFAHPIHDRIFYLNTKHKRKLKEEFVEETWKAGIDGCLNKGIVNLKMLVMIVECSAL